MRHVGLVYISFLVAVIRVTLVPMCFVCIIQAVFKLIYMNFKNPQKVSKIYKFTSCMGQLIEFSFLVFLG